MNYIKYDILNEKYHPNKRIKAPTILIVSFFLVYFFNTLGLYNIRFGQIILLMIGAIGIFYTFLRNDSKNNFIILSIIWISIIFGLFSYLINSNASLAEYLWPIAYVGVSVLLLNFDIEDKPITIMYYSICAYYIFAMLTNLMPEDLTGHVSRNTLSITILSFFVLLCIVRYKKNKKISPFSSYLGLIVAFWAVGRSGIITFLIISIGFTLFSFRGQIVKKMRSYKVLILVIIIISLLYIFRELLIYPAIYYYNRWGLESGRTIIWKNYIYGIMDSPLYILVGYPLNSNSVFSYFAFNLHNSFLNLHSRYGLFIFSYFMYKIIQKMYQYVVRKKTLYFILLLAIIFRASFDLAAFNGVLDIFIYYFVFEDKFNKKREVKII